MLSVPSGADHAVPACRRSGPRLGYAGGAGELVVLCTWITPPPQAHTPHAHLEASIYTTVSALPSQGLSGLNTQHLTSALRP